MTAWSMWAVRIKALPSFLCLASVSGEGSFRMSSSRSHSLKVSQAFTQILSHPLSKSAAKLSVSADGITISTDENYHSYEVTERLKHPAKGVTRCVAVVLLWLFGDFQTCCLTQERYSLVSPFEFFDGKAGIAHVAAGVHEGNHFCGILFEGILGEVIAVV